MGSPEIVMGVRLANWEREGNKDGVMVEEGKPEQVAGFVLLSVEVCKEVQEADGVARGEEEVDMDEKEDWEELGVKSPEDEVDGESVPPEAELEGEEGLEAEARTEGALC